MQTTMTLTLPTSPTRPVTARSGFGRMSDHDLLVLSRSGNAAAAHCLIGRHRHVIESVARRVSHSRTDAADLVSEIYLRVFDVLNSCRNAAALPAWIKRVALNVFRGLYRRDRRRPSISLEVLEEAAGDRLLPVVDDPEQMPESRLERRERDQRIHRAVASLSAEHRELVRMFYLEDLCYEEIAVRTGLKPGTVKSRLFRAREALVRKLGDMIA